MKKTDIFFRQKSEMYHVDTLYKWMQIQRKLVPLYVESDKI